MKLSFNLAGIGKRLRTNVVPVLWFGLLVVLILAGWVIKGQIDTVLGAKKVETFVLTKLPRINFGVYEGIEKKFDENNTFTPSTVVEANPFGIIQVIEPPQSQ
jgi:hypothetical protein